ncbi:MAG: T9SS type A sorting domain-containing protein [Bacteroidota bacterium]
MYPNPSKNYFILELNVKEKSSATIKLTDVRGREVLLTSHVFSKGKNIETISTSDFASGVYFLEINVGNQILRAKVVRED